MFYMTESNSAKSICKVIIAVKLFSAVFLVILFGKWNGVFFQNSMCFELVG